MATRRTLRIDQGSNYDLLVRYLDDAGQPKVLTGYHARMQIRETAASAPVLSITSQDASPEITVSEDGEITVALLSATTQGLDARQYVYDIEIYTASNIVKRILEGRVIVSPEVTK